MQLLSCYLFHTRCAAAGRMPKLSPASTDLGSDTQAAFAFAAMSPQLTHLQRSEPFDLGICGTFMKCMCLLTWHLHARQSQESIRSRDLHSFETVHRAVVSGVKLVSALQPARCHGSKKLLNNTFLSS